VPFRLLKNFHKIQQRLVRELEKKFSGKDVVVVANRRIMPPPTGGKSNARPRSRTLTAVSAVARASSSNYTCRVKWRNS
jgi:small subunit ribosomal protein S7e